MQLFLETVNMSAIWWWNFTVRHLAYFYKKHVAESHFGQVGHVLVSALVATCNGRDTSTKLVTETHSCLWIKYTNIVRLKRATALCVYMLRRGLQHYGIYMVNSAVTYTIVAVAGSMFISDGHTDRRMDRWTWAKTIFSFLVLWTSRLKI